MLDSPDSERDPYPSARDLFAGAGEAIVVHNGDDGTILDANPAAERLYGYDAGTLRGEQIDAVLVDDAADSPDLETLAEQSGGVQWLVATPDGDQRWVDVRVSLRGHHGGDRPVRAPPGYRLPARHRVRREGDAVAGPRL
ncbi:hypothetical protein BRC96_02285 [Halobacteriales archaeon QS_6_64_34]|nr:MAG: hypothetical protein BRC96_02285 [Halobacteriales archaeon QS_6_64_34]